MKNYIPTVIILALIWFVLLKPESRVELGPGVKAAMVPIQNDSSDAKFQINDFQITPLAEFNLTGKILGKEYYKYDSGAELSFVDLAMGWGPMSDESVLEKIEISQSGRWYRWQVDEFPIPRREIETHSANMHIIPADDWIKEQIEDTPPGSIVQFKGFLVRADKSDGWNWVSSLTRDDIGDGACELVYVKEFYVIE